ncbi:hypothetical protein A2W24_02205 [Microgenomates group bacterium RBG_16_45_19]|nr:MAG: hypothetical protein A2W24_02205 [Microgenomates group bacterium RBG_16_45_19]
MLTQATSLRLLCLSSELAALLVEAQLVKHYQPPYNQQLKDDKSPLYLCVTAETYPRLLTLRRPQLPLYPNSQLFGPFLSATELKRLLTQARAVFPYCQLSPRQKQLNRPCFYTHLNLCPGACCGRITPAAYGRLIRQLLNFLQGNPSQTQRYLTRALHHAIKSLDFETAQTLKKRLERLLSFETSWHLSRVTSLPVFDRELSRHQLQNIPPLLHQAGLTISLKQLERLEMYDVAHLQGQAATGAMVVALSGQLSPQAYRHFTLKGPVTQNDPLMLSEILQRRFRHHDWPTPGLVIVDGGHHQLTAVAPLLPPGVALIGLAKHPDHLVVLKPTGSRRLTLIPGTPAANLLLTLRDEAHRFARRLHHHHTRLV